MKLLDSKFKNNKKQYIFQCLMATLSLLIIFGVIDYVLHTVVVASLGATSFIIFTLPHRNSSRVRYILGGYVLGSIAGGICALLVSAQVLLSPMLVGALAVGLSMFLMVIFNMEHPPASAFALGIAIEGFDLKTVFFVFVVTIVLLVIKYLNRKWFIDLI